MYAAIPRTIVLLCLAMLLAACQKPGYSPPVNQDLTLGVAAFTQPIQLEDLLAGYTPEDQETVDPQVLADLDVIFSDVLREKTKRAVIGPDAALRCQKLMSYQREKEPCSALDYWVNVGECLKVDYLLVPMLLAWQEREGSGAGATVPAAVTLDVFVIDIRDKSLLSRGHFEETQAALTDNLLDAGKFISRGAKWVTARELAQEGLVQVVKELGL